MSFFLKRESKQLSEFNRLSELNMISRSLSSMNLNINHFVIFLPLLTDIVVPHASSIFIYLLTVNVLNRCYIRWAWCLYIILLWDTVSHLPFLFLSAICHINKILWEFLDFVSIFGMNFLDFVETDRYKWTLKILIQSYYNILHVFIPH